MLEHSFGLLFFLKAGKSTGGMRQVYLRITVDGLVKELSIKMPWTPERWHKGAGRATGTKEDARVLNNFLDTLTAKVYEARTGLLRSGKKITASKLRDLITGKHQSSHTLLSVFGQHNDHMKMLIGRHYAPATYTRYRTALKHTCDFIAWKYHQADLELTELDYEFIADFEFYLKSVKNCAHNSAMKYLANLRKVIAECILKGWLAGNPFAGFKMKLTPVRPVALTTEDLRQLSLVTLPERLQLVKNVFLFSCFTGLAWIDVRQLMTTQINIGTDGEAWISISRQKTGTPTTLPLLPAARDILGRYSSHPKCVATGRALPVLSNQKMNLYLKEIAARCGLQKRLTFHIARHTFATTITLANGVPLNTVSKLLGHKSVQQTEHYAQLSEEMIRHDMALLQAKLRTQPVLLLN